MQDSNPLQPSDSMIGKLLVASTTVQDPLLARSVCLVVHQDAENIFAVLLNRPMSAPPGLAKLLDAAGVSDGDPTAKPSQRPHPNRLRKGKLNQVQSFPTNFPDGVAAASDNTPDAPVPASSDQTFADQTVAEITAAQAAKTLGTIHFGGPLSGPVVAVHNSSEHAEAVAGKGVYVAAQRDLLETLVKHKPSSFRLIVGHLGWSVDQLQSEIDAGFWHLIDATEDDVFVGDQDLWPSVIRRATTKSLARWLAIKDSPFAAEVN
ncbi:YqgE/AlgH family protein [Stieleria sp. TO1_6]|uniref:YqgE/AlgH family protein n=1 Tax=Stieleria tagensis TaxID=2956795 RepID=UPI00209B7DE8|nr:YqgE/AlgH family protein [Stieleria tagensis]MCO8122013.1 YqgE/AlgH family protein [Stieleria tagensis]